MAGEAPVDRVLVVGANRPGERWREALAGESVISAGDRWAAMGALRSDDFAVVVLMTEALATAQDLEALLGLVADSRPSPLVVAVAKEAVGPTADALLDHPTGLVAEVVADDQLSIVLRRAVRRAARLRALQLANDLHESTLGLTRVTEAEELPTRIAEVAHHVTGADLAAYVGRGADGKLALSAQLGPSSPAFAGLVRRSQRLEREPVSGPVREQLPDHDSVGLVIRTDDHFHGVVWILRSGVRRRFSERELGAFEVVGERALLASERLRLVRDLSDRLTSMEATRERLEEDGRAATVGRLAVDALNALRAPLAYSRTNLRAAMDSGEVRPNSEAGRHLQYVLDGLTRADQAVEDLSRVSQGRDRVPVEVRQLLEAALSQARPLRVQEAVEVSENAVILGNPGRLAQALAEIVRNADQAEGTSRIDLRASRDGDEVAIEIADDGEGIPPDVLPKATDPFFSTRGRAGLGLTTAKDVIERSGGTLSIWSRRGVGTIVRVRLPGQEVEEELLGEAPEDEVEEVEVSLDDLLG